MKLQELDGYGDAARAVNANRGPRYEALDRLERFVDTTQYDHLPDWFDPRPSSTPLWARRPCIAYPIVQAAIASNVALLLGEGRFPAIDTMPDEEQGGDDAGLSPADHEVVASAVAELFDAARVRAVSREAYEHAQATSAAVAILGVRDGLPFVDTTKAKWCTPNFNVDGSVRSLEIRYAYITQVRGEDGRPRAQPQLYRRLITAERDTTFLPAEADENGREPQWIADQSRTIVHGLGFCPVIWYAYRRGCAAVGQVDGTALHAHVLDEIQALDIALSMRHRCAIYLEPQVCEFGVRPGYNPTEAAVQSPVLAHPGAPIDVLRNPEAVTALSSYVGATRTAKSARAKGPGFTWQYASEKARVELLAMPAGALEALDQHCRDLKNKIAESLATVFVDPEDIRRTNQTLSGKALRLLKERQLDHCDQDREEFGEGFLIPVARMLLRISVAVPSLRVRGIRSARASIERFLLARASLRLRWGEYFKRDAAEELEVVKLVQAAYEGGLVTERMAMRKLAGVFGVRDVDAAIEELKQQRDEQDRLAAEREAAQNAALHDFARAANANGEADARPGA